MVIIHQHDMLFKDSAFNNIFYKLRKNKRHMGTHFPYFSLYQIKLINSFKFFLLARLDFRIQNFLCNLMTVIL